MEYEIQYLLIRWSLFSVRNWSSSRQEMLAQDLTAQRLELVFQTGGLPVENSEWSAFQVHLKNDCQFEELPCVRADCKERVLRKDLRDHVEKACKYREATCSHCKSQVPMVTLQVQCPLASPPWLHPDAICPQSSLSSDYSLRNKEKRQA